MDALTPIHETLLAPERLSWLSELLESGTCTSRRQVARALCEQLDFQDARVLPRISSCSAALAKLEVAGKISLPVSPARAVMFRLLFAVLQGTIFMILVKQEWLIFSPNG